MTVAFFRVNSGRVWPKSPGFRSGSDIVCWGSGYLSIHFVSIKKDANVVLVCLWVFKYHFKSHEFMYAKKLNFFCFGIRVFSSVRSSNSHPDLLLTQHPLFSSHRSSLTTFTFWATTAISRAIMPLICWLMDTWWESLAPLMTSWALPGDNLGMTWGWLGHYLGKNWQDLRTPLDNFGISSWRHMMTRPEYNRV